MEEAFDYSQGTSESEYTEYEEVTVSADTVKSFTDYSVSRLIMKWLVYLGIFLLPLWFLPFTSDVLEFNKQVLLTIVVGAGLILFLIDLIKTGTVRYRKSVFYLPILILTGTSIIATIFSVYSHSSIFGLGTQHAVSMMSWISFAVLFFLGLQVSDREGKGLRTVTTVSLAIALIIGALQVVGLSIFSGTRFDTNAFNTVGSMNSLAMIAAIAMPLLLSFRKRGNIWETVVSILSYVGIVAGIFILAVVNWFPVWVVTFIALLAYLGFSVFVNPKKGSIRTFALPIGIIVLGLFLTLLGNRWDTFQDKLPLEVAPTHGTSYAIARDALESKPMGYGPENFSLAFDQFKPKDIANGIFFNTTLSNASSEVANIMIEGGVFMIAALVIFLWFYLRSLIWQVENRFYGDSAGIAMWASGIGMIVLIFLYPFNLSFMLILFVLLMLMSLHGANRGDAGEEVIIDLESNNTFSFVGSLAFIIGLVLVLSGGYFTVVQYMSNVKIANALTAEDRDTGIETLVSAVNNNRGDSRAHRLLSQLIIADIAADLQEGAIAGETAEDFRSRINNRIELVTRIVLDSTTVAPADAQNWMSRGFVYQNMIGLNIEDSGPFAISMYEEALVHNPYNPLAYFRIGSTYLAMADRLEIIKGPQADRLAALDSAEENFNKAIDLYNNYGQALYNLAVVYDRKGEIPQAINQFEKLVISNPTDPSIVFQLGLLYYRNNQKDNAVVAWEQAVRLFPDYSNARWYLSLAYEEKGEINRAIAQVEEILVLNPENELAMERLEELSAGVRIIPPEGVLDQEPLE
ncbi:MAG: tetratricopeptide repeat protein [Parcubacteria group bacterium]